MTRTDWPAYTRTLYIHQSCPPPQADVLLDVSPSSVSRQHTHATHSTPTIYTPMHGNRVEANAKSTLSFPVSREYNRDTYMHFRVPGRANEEDTRTRIRKSDSCSNTLSSHTPAPLTPRTTQTHPHHGGKSPTRYLPPKYRRSPKMNAPIYPAKYAPSSNPPSRLASPTFCGEGSRAW